MLSLFLKLLGFLLLSIEFELVEGLINSSSDPFITWTDVDVDCNDCGSGSGSGSGSGNDAFCKIGNNSVARELFLPSFFPASI